MTRASRAVVAVFTAVQLFTLSLVSHISLEKALLKDWS